MSKKISPQEAQLILQLYDLRREAEMRKARSWVGGFNPGSADEVINVVMQFGSPENAWLRQVTGYWDMVATLVLHGAIDPDVFMSPGIGGEMVFVYAKIQPFIKELREKVPAPDLFLNVEKVVMGSKVGRERLERMKKRIAAMSAKAK